MSVMSIVSLFFFFSSRRRHTRYWRDWSSDVCSSDLVEGAGRDGKTAAAGAREGFADDIAALPRPRDLMRDEVLAAIECDHGGALHELRDARGRILHQI